MASKVAVGIVLLGKSSEYVNNNRKDSVGSTLSVKEQATNASSTSTNDIPTVEITASVVQPLEKTHTRSMSLVHLNKLMNQKRSSEPPLLAPIEGGDELNETSFRDADDNYQCLINDQNCPPVSNFSKASTPANNNNNNNNENINNNNSSTITEDTDEGIVFTTQTSITKQKTDLDDVERFKMCGNSIIA